jgi:hypothetical protein
MLADCCFKNKILRLSLNLINNNPVGLFAKKVGLLASDHKQGQTAHYCIIESNRMALIANLRKKKKLFSRFLVY